ncbi:25900_t:CDS:2, partial [Gigaspora rosea]
AFEGRSTTWILEELCKDPESKLITIDIFVKIFPNNDNEATFHEKKMSFDFIYIDGSHESHDVLSDTVLSWNLLKGEYDS